VGSGRVVLFQIAMLQFDDLNNPVIDTIIDHGYPGGGLDTFLENNTTFATTTRQRIVNKIARIYGGDSATTMVHELTLRGLSRKRRAVNLPPQAQVLDWSVHNIDCRIYAALMLRAGAELGQLPRHWGPIHLLKCWWPALSGFSIC